MSLVEIEASSNASEIGAKRILSAELRTAEVFVSGTEVRSWKIGHIVICCLRYQEKFLTSRDTFQSEPEMGQSE